MYIKHSPLRKNQKIYQVSSELSLNPLNLMPEIRERY